MAALSKKLRSVEGGRIMFWCPGCDGAHAIGVGVGEGPRWEFNGDFDAPTFRPSVLVRSGHYADGTPAEDCHLCKRAAARNVKPFCSICHSYVDDGRIQFLGDSTHALAGQTVDIPDFDEA
jgi:hypothetical protein